MNEEYERKKRKQITLMRSMLDIGMGIVILLAGIFFLIRTRLGEMEFNKRFPPDDIDYFFGALCLLYGGWRLYRGIRKNYFR